MILPRLIFLVGPLLAVTFNTKSQESKKPEIDGDSRSFTREQIANLKIERDKLQELQNRNIQRQQILLDDVSTTEDFSPRALVIVKRLLKY